MAFLEGAEVTDATAEHTSSMSASFQPPGPAKRARPAVSSRFSTTSAQVASISMLMSFVVRHMCPTCKTGNQSPHLRRDILLMCPIHPSCIKNPGLQDSDREPVYRLVSREAISRAAL